MKNISFHNKKIGIWGFGIVGKSILQWLENTQCSIQILDKQTQDHPAWIMQTPETVQLFLEQNDYIITSPGIPIHQYQKYHHKFVCELDIFQQHFRGYSIAITGSIGKTSITKAIAHCTPHSIAAGNIGYPMLSALSQHTQNEKIILELSSFQLLWSQTFAPDIALLTNFYPNHLDYHQDEDEYFSAKCTLFKYQNENQKTIVPCNLIEKIKKTVQLKSHIFLTCTQQCLSHDFSTFFIEENNVVLANTKNEKAVIIKNIDQFPFFTYQENWIQIIAALFLQDDNTIDHIHEKLKTIAPQQHRLEKILIHQETTFYNDSKSTVWQATKAALQKFENQPCALFLGGVSKGTDRTPLIQFLKNKPITVFAFGKEAEMLKTACDHYQIQCSSYKNLQDAVKSCLSQTLPKNVIFSPAGASFDLFEDYQERGNTFKELIFKNFR
ncbi:UDP-N-acetylmuramoyl-L-alanine--D-glutamate ligase [Candidatus Dependentiae bacterium]|nr:UDP-N-acetylmuramoyl-L-alanine--D-glutamate ligase [Candidatus Dependentiae bacterium]